ncbi:MAG: polysaccharide biosynthesis/export family protein [Pseudomonadota bacterium]
MLFKRSIHAIIFTVVFLSLAPLSKAQQPPSEEQIRQARAAAQQSQSVDLSQFIQSGNNDIGRSPVPNLPAVQQDSSGVQPFGANLFQGGFVAQRSDGLNSQYKVAPGDKIAIQMWGAVARSEVVTVDNQGNIFVPDVGPISVKDVPANNLNAVVTGSIKRIFPNNVNLYTNLLTATPVSVFVAGPVVRPGQYAGLASDSILFYLNRAGGIDPVKGSYRNISVLREGKEIISFDLYAFLRKGELGNFSFKDNDVVLVDDQGPMITVEGEARNAVKFELTKNENSGVNIVDYSKPKQNASHVAITGNREDGPFSIYLTIDEFSHFKLVDGDTVLFNDDLRSDIISVQISGSYLGPSFYTLKKGSRLVDLLSHIEIDPSSADYKNVFIKRESVVEQQKMLIEESLQRLERSIFTAPASSDGEAAIRAQEASLVTQFIARARRVEPLGKVIVSDSNNVANLRLEQGDVIVIPEQTDLIQVSGEVLMPKAIVYNQNASVGDYISWAGGFTERAEDERIVILHANGATSFSGLGTSNYWIGGKSTSTLKPGDQILVLPKVDAKIMQSIKDISQILSQIAITANVVLD